MQSCRNALKDLQGGSNASLLMAHYLTETKGDADNSQEAISARAVLFNAMREAVRYVVKGKLYEAAFNRRKAILDPFTLANRFQTKGVMALGLGGSNVLETGLTLNPLYGTPMIPGTSIKGIVAHYCSTVLGAADSRYKGPNVGQDGKPRQKAGDIYEALFGKLEQEQAGTDGREKAESGFLRFYDAWMTPEDIQDSLVLDVMTPHHGDYYMEKAEKPTDFDSPNPVTFMTVKGTFEVHIGCEEPDPEKREAWLRFSRDITRAALTAWGVGGKTHAGYGRMKEIRPIVPPPPPPPTGVVICSGRNKKGNPQFKLNGKKATFSPPLGKDSPYQAGDSIETFAVESFSETNGYVLKLDNKK